KNGKPRKIKLDDESIQLLKKWKKEQAEVLLKLGFDTQKQNQLVFPNMDNNLEDPNKTYEWLKGILDKYNLDYITRSEERRVGKEYIKQGGQESEAEKGKQANEGRE